jgi:PAS domain S-box-containing protein
MFWENGDMQAHYTILLVDDSESDRGIYRRYLMTDKNFDYQILEAESLEEALELWRSQSPDLVLTDIHLPDGNGLELLEAIEKIYPSQKFPVIMMTGEGDERLAVQAMKLGASDYLVKDDITASTLCHYVETAIAQWKLSEKLTQLRQQLEIQNSDLRQAVEASKMQKDFNRLIAEISSRFGEVTDETLDFEINRSLQLIGEMSQVDTAYLFTLDRDRQTLSMSHEWSQSGSPRQIAIAQNVPFAAFPYSIALILQQEYCCVKDTALLPPEAAVDAASWQQFKIKSFVSLPLIQKGKTVGFIGFASFGQAIAWDEEIIQILTILSQTIVNTQERIEAENIRKQNEIELTQWRKRYELAEQASGQMIYEYDFLTNSVIWGANATLILGYAEPDLPRHLTDWLAFIHPEDLSSFQQALATANINKTPFFCQYRFLHEAGHYIWLEDCNRWLLDEQGEGIGVIGMITDISDEKDVELILRKQALVFENMTDGVIITDMDGLIIDWNRGAENLYGYTKAEILGKSPSRLHTLEDSQWLQTEIFQTTLQNGFWSGEVAVVCKDGTQKITTTSTVLLKDNQKNNISIIGLNHDITKLKKIEEELRQSNEQLQGFNQELEIRVEERTHKLQASEAFNRSILETLPDLLLRLDRNANCLSYMAPKVGKNNFQEIFNHTSEFLPPDLVERQLQAIEQALITGELQVYEHQLFKNNQTAYEEVRILAINEQEVLVIVRDISDRKRMELNLQQSEEINRTILETIPDFLIHMDRQGSYIRKSKGQNVRVIEPENDSLELNIHNILSRDLAEQQLYFANLAIETGTLQLFEQIVDFPDERRYEEVRIAPLHNQEVLMIIRDITDRKQTEQTIRQQAEKETLLRQITQRIRESLNLQTIFDRACQEIRQFIQSDRVGIFKFYPEYGCDDGEFVAESVKEGFSSVLAIRVHDHCFGEDYAKRYTKGHFQAVNDVLQSDLQDCHKAILSQFGIRANLVIPLLLGEKLWGLLCIHTCVAPRIWQPNEIDLIQQLASQLAIAIQQANLFEPLQQEQEKLLQTNKELARATRLKDEFLANMSHELRTPLTAILGMSEALQENTFGDINPAQEKAIKLIEKSGEHLLSLINDILDLSKIEAGKLELEFAPTSVKTLCENSTMFVKQMAFTKKIELQTRIAKNIEQIQVDEFRIRQSLINLLSNAIKFTPAGGNVILSVELEEQEILFSVTDTGIGINPTDLDKLFQPFIQIDSSLNRQYAGTGLGLVLVERIITKHGGRVSVTSRVGEGSCFTLRLPYVPSSRKIIPENVETTSLSTNETNAPLSVYPLILLADDNEANRQTLDDYLSNKGYRMLLAYNGREAVEIVKTHRPDLVFMDIQMPEMDGLEATTLIRSDPAIADIPIIALTALAFPEQADQCFYAGFNDYLAKPVRFKILMDTIQKFCQRHED